MMQTNKEYMSDMARIERIVQKFMNITLKDLKDKETEKHLHFITEAVIPREGLSEEKIQDMSYIEFACLVNNAGGNPEYDWSDHDSWSEQRIYYQCMASILIKKCKNSIPVKLFLAIPVKNFYDYLYKAADSGKEPFCLYDKSAVMGLRNKYTLLTKNCKMRDGYTIKDFLQDKCALMNKAWCPITSIEKYAGDIKTAHEDAGKLLVDSFLLAFPGRCRVEDIRNKYHASDMPDEMEIEEDEWWDELPF